MYIFQLHLISGTEGINYFLGFKKKHDLKFEKYSLTFSEWVKNCVASAIPMHEIIWNFHLLALSLGWQVLNVLLIFSVFRMQCAIQVL